VAKVARVGSKVATRVPSTGLKMAKMANLMEMGDTSDTLDRSVTLADASRLEPFASPSTDPAAEDLVRGLRKLVSLARWALRHQAAPGGRGQGRGIIPVQEWAEGFGREAGWARGTR
jgi:hypothetical protein